MFKKLERRYSVHYTYWRVLLLLFVVFRPEMMIVVLSSQSPA